MRLIFLAVFLLSSFSTPSSSAPRLCGRDLRAGGVNFEPRPQDLLSSYKTVSHFSTYERAESLYVTDVSYSRSAVFKKVLKTSDGGSSWQLLQSQMSTNLSSGTQIERSPYDGSVVYRLEGLVYLRSLDQGRSWATPAYTIEDLSAVQFAARRSNNSKARLYIILDSVNPVDPRTIFASFGWYVPDERDPTTLKESHPLPGTFVSYDAGDTWHLFSGALVFGSSLGISPSDPKVMIGVSKDGVVKTMDGGVTWKPVGEQDALSRPVAQSSADEIDAAAKTLNVSPDSVRARAALGLQVYKIEFQKESSVDVLLITNKGLYQSHDGGNSWYLLKVGPDRIGFVNSALYDPQNSHTMYLGTDFYVAKSVDDGCTFRSVYP